MNWILFTVFIFGAFASNEKTEKKAQHKGVYLNKENRAWRVIWNFKGQKKQHGGIFKDELGAAKRVNQLCKELGIRVQYPTISAILSQQCQKKTCPGNHGLQIFVYKRCTYYYCNKCEKNVSDGEKMYGCRLCDFDMCLDCWKKPIQITISWNAVSKKWVAQVVNEKTVHGRLFENKKYDAMKGQNQTSKYTGVCWDKHSKKWVAQLTLNNKTYDGELFENEEYAAMWINLLCDEYKIERQNPNINIQADAIRPSTGVSWNAVSKSWVAHKANMEKRKRKKN